MFIFEELNTDVDAIIDCVLLLGLSALLIYFVIHQGLLGGGLDRARKIR